MMRQFWDLDQVLTKVKTALSKMTAIPQDRLRDLDSLDELFAVDSLSIVILRLELEEEFGILISNSVLTNVKSIRNVGECVLEQLLKGK